MQWGPLELGRTRDPARVMRMGPSRPQRQPDAHPRFAAQFFAATPTLDKVTLGRRLLPGALEPGQRRSLRSWVVIRTLQRLLLGEQRYINQNSHSDLSNTLFWHFTSDCKRPDCHREGRRIRSNGVFLGGNRRFGIPSFSREVLRDDDKTSTQKF